MNRSVILLGSYLYGGRAFLLDAIIATGLLPSAFGGVAGVALGSSAGSSAAVAAVSSPDDLSLDAAAAPVAAGDGVAGEDSCRGGVELSPWGGLSAVDGVPPPAGGSARA